MALHIGGILLEFRVGCEHRNVSTIWPSILLTRMWAEAYKAGIQEILQSATFPGIVTTAYRIVDRGTASWLRRSVRGCNEAVPRKNSCTRVRPMPSL